MRICNISFIIIFLFIISASFAQEIGKITIKGNKSFKTTKLLPLIKSRWETDIDTNFVEEDRKALENFYFDNGYLETVCRKKIVKRKSATGYKIEFRINEGSLYYFGQIFVQGNVLFNNKFIKKLIKIKSDQPFSRKKIVDGQYRALATGYFEEVEIKAKDVDFENKKIDIVIKITEKSRHSAELGSGLDTEDGFKLLFEWKNRNLNGQGRSLKISGLGSIDYVDDFYYKRSKFAIQISEPFLLNTPVNSKLILSYNRDKPNYVNFGYEIYNLETILNYNINNWNKIYLALRFERDNIFNVPFGDQPTQFERKFVSENNRVATLMFESDYRDDIIDASNGTFFNTSVHKSGGLIGGAYDYYKFLFNFHVYHGLLRRLVIANKTSFNTIEFLEDRDLPSYLKFFLGGTSSIRGYNEKDIGPKNEDGSSRGGLFLFFNSFELRYYLMYNLNFVTFLDFGNNWTNRPAARINSLKYTTGFGTRLKTEYGMFRLDFGIKISDYSKEDIGQIHFGFGQSF